MDLDGIEAAVLFGGGPLGTANSELYIASFEGYNRWLWDFCGADRKRLVGVAYLPMRDVDETLRLMREVAKLGFRTINIPAFPQSRDGLTSSSKVAAIAAGQGAALTGNPGGERTYRDAEFDRFWAEVADLDLTVTIHLGGRIPRFGEKEHFLADMVMSKMAMAEPIAIAIFGGIFQRYPKLRFCTVESGVGWMAWAAEYMDRTWERQRYWTESKITEKPSFYMNRNVYASFIQDRVGILSRHLPGAGNIMWSSDYPHSETTFPKSHEIIARDFEGVPEAEVRMIAGERARRCMQLGEADDITAIHYVPSRRRNAGGQLATPDASGPRPAVMVMHDAHGLGNQVRDTARRLAQLGYIALATDMYGGGVLHADPKAAGAVARAAMERRSFATLARRHVVRNVASASGCRCQAHRGDRLLLWWPVRAGTRTQRRRRQSRGELSRHPQNEIACGARRGTRARGRVHRREGSLCTG